MNLSELERHVLAFYIATDAGQFSMDPRFWPYAELVIIFEDKIRFSAQRFDIRDEEIIVNAARAFVDLLIERGGISTIRSDLGGTMHRLEGKEYRECVAWLRESDPIIAAAKSGGSGFWPDAFTRVNRGPGE